MKRKVLTCLLVLVMSSVTFAENDLRQSISTPIQDGPEKLDVGALDERVIRSIEKESKHSESRDTRIRYLVYLWFLRDSREDLRLRWWESESREERLVILKLFFALSDEPIKTVPDFVAMAEKFGEERNQRIEEIKAIRGIPIASLRVELRQWADRNLTNVTPGSQAEYLLEFYGGVSATVRKR